MTSCCIMFTGTRGSGHNGEVPCFALPGMAAEPKGAAMPGGHVLAVCRYAMGHMSEQYAEHRYESRGTACLDGNYGTDLWNGVCHAGGAAGTVCGLCLQSRSRNGLAPVFLCASYHPTGSDFCPNDQDGALHSPGHGVRSGEYRGSLRCDRRSLQRRLSGDAGGCSEYCAAFGDCK